MTSSSPRHDVIDEMRINRRHDIASPGLDIRKKANQRLAVVAFGKALLVHQPFAFRIVGQQKSVGRHEFDLRRIGPARQQRLQNARRGRFADRDRTGDADDIGNLAVLGAEKSLRRFEQALRRRDIERQQARQRQIDCDDLFDRNRIVAAISVVQIVDRERHRRIGAQAAHSARLKCR